MKKGRNLLTEAFYVETDNLILYLGSQSLPSLEFREKFLCWYDDNHRLHKVNLQLQRLSQIRIFVRILQKNYKGPDVPMEAFEKTTLNEWQKTIHSNK